MSYPNEESTLSQVLCIMKKSFMRALIYVLVCVAIATATLFTAQALTISTSNISTIYVSEQSKITLQKVNYNKGLAVQKALKNLDYDTTDEALTSAILKNLSINAIVPANLDKNTEFFPTTYNLSLTSNNLSGISTAKLTELLDEISKELLNSLGISELPEIKVYNTLDTDLKVLEYFQVADELYLQAENVYSIVNSQITSKNKATEYADPASGKTLTDVATTLNIILTRIDNLKTYIITNRIENVNNLKTILETKKSQASTKQQAYESMANKALEVLNKFPAGSTGGNNSTIVIDGEAYENLAIEYYTLLNLEGVASRDVSLYSDYLTTIDSIVVDKSSEDYQNKKNYTQAELRTIFDDVSLELDTYRNLAKEYNENYFTVTEAKIVSPSRAVKVSPITFQIIILVDVLVALIAYLVAYFQTKSKLKTNNCNCTEEKKEETPIKE